MSDQQVATSDSTHQVENANAPIKKVASGQKLIILAILVNLVSTVLQFTVHPYLGALGLIGSVMAIIGLIRMMSGLKKPVALVVVMCFAMLIPVLNLLVLLSQNAQATKALRNAGYEVGLFGASETSTP